MGTITPQPQLPKSSADRKAALLKAQQERCFNCRIQLNVSETTGIPHPQDATIDHFIPLSRGGARGWPNRILFCKPCNRPERKSPADAGGDAALECSQNVVATPPVPELELRLQPVGAS